MNTYIVLFHVTQHPNLTRVNSVYTCGNPRRQEFLLTLQFRRTFQRG